MSHFCQNIGKLIQEEFAISGVKAYLSSYLPFKSNDSNVNNRGNCFPRPQAIPLSQRLNPTKEVENNIKAVATSIQIMNDDACCMFTYGITIVEDHVTLWYHSQSHSAMSKHFSFVEMKNLALIHWSLGKPKVT
ncbi:hypothetical protein BDN71DRAFT_1436743 [Pleurotus eryngii]|uniref:Uncharacterized protein n=1 Tax=Pleurotus eryngii TaxID=5323 RepID=A0A9P5ZKQ8_PLEER|nr:hypothetical protein BDN71DRAFT_1436743 [Pleurotus eryngii]